MVSKTCGDYLHQHLDGLCRFFNTIQSAFVNICILWNGLAKSLETIHSLMLVLVFYTFIVFLTHIT